MHLIKKIKYLLLNNKTSKQTIIKNTFWLSLSEIISKGLKIVLVVYIARILGATEYGKFTFALTFVSFLILLSNFGLNKISIREFSRNQKKKEEFFSVITLRFILTLIALIITIVGSFFITQDHSIRNVMWILMFYIAFNNFAKIIYTFLRAREQMQYESAFKILRSILLTVVGLFIIFKMPSLKNLSYGYLVTSTTSLILLLVFFHYKILKLKFCFNANVWKKFLTMAWPVALFMVCSKIYTQIDSIMMGIWEQITEVGWYNAAYKIVNIAILPGSLVASSLYPAISKASKKKKGLQKLCNYRINTATLIAVPLSIAGITLAKKIIVFIYGKDFLPSILAFKILIIMGSILLLIRTLNEILIILNKQIKVFWIAFSGAIINIILNFILIPRYTLYGAAVSTLITMILMLVFYYIVTKKYTTIKTINKNTFITLLASIFGSILMYLIISLLIFYETHILFIIMIGIIVYVLSIYLIKQILNLKIYEK